jgi:hypothetical protein
VDRWTLDPWTLLLGPLWTHDGDDDDGGDRRRRRRRRRKTQRRRCERLRRRRPFHSALTPLGYARARWRRIRTYYHCLAGFWVYVHCCFFEVPRCGPDSTERAPASEDREVESGKLENHYYYDDGDDYSGHASPPFPLPFQPLLRPAQLEELTCMHSSHLKSVVD